MTLSCFFFFLLFTLVTGPRRSSSLKWSDARVYEPQIRARLVTTAHFWVCSVAEEAKTRRIRDEREGGGRREPHEVCQGVPRPRLLGSGGRFRRRVQERGDPRPRLQGSGGRFRSFRSFTFFELPA